MRQLPANCKLTAPAGSVAREFRRAGANGKVREPAGL
jgi:hypothetical protein